MAQTITPAWTISIIAQTEEENKSEYQALTQDINQNLNERLNFVIYKFNQDNNSAEIWKAYRNQELSRVRNIPQASLFNTDKLINFFNDDVLSNNTEYHMLITWGHGAGLGYFFYDRNTDTGSKTKNNILGNRKILNDIDEQKEAEIGNMEYEKNKKGFNIKNVHYNLLLANLSRKTEDEEKLRSITDCLKHGENIDEFKLRTKLLMAEDLAYILEQSFGQQQKKVNVFIATNCWVNMFEVGWALKNVVDIYAAPQTVIPFAGINYKKLFQELSVLDYSENTATRPPLKIARNLTENFLLKYSEREQEKAKMAASVESAANQNEIEKKEVAQDENANFDVDVRQISISVNHLRNYGSQSKTTAELDNEGIAGIINNLSGFLINKLRSKQKKYYLQRIDIARSYCGDFTQQGVYFVDFTSFFCELIKGFQADEADELKELYKQFFFLKEKSLLSLLSPGELFRFMPTDFYSQSPQMFSVFFPSRFGKSNATDNFMALYNDKTSCSKFQKASLWDDFITEYWNCS